MNAKKRDIDLQEFLTCSASSLCRQSNILQRTLHTTTEPTDRVSATISVAFSIKDNRHLGSRLPDKLYRK